MPNDFSKLNNQTEENLPPEAQKEAAPSEEIFEGSENIPFEPEEQPPQPIDAPPKFDPYREMPPEEEYLPKF